MIWLNGLINMDLSIVILNYQQKGLVKYCLKNLLSLDIPLKYEIIVVDNNSHDGLDRLISEQFLRVKFIQAGQNRGYAAGNNLGIKAASGKYILILNPDIRILSNAIMGLYNFMEANPNAGLAGPKILNPDNSLQYTCSRFPDWRLPFYRRTSLGATSRGKLWLNRYLMLDWNHEENKKVDWLFGACLIVKKSALENVGLLDEKYFLYMEDLDWCRRFWENKWQVWYVAGACVIHFHQRTSAEKGLWLAFFSKTARIHLASWLSYFNKFRNKSLPKHD